jgi:hypothetical protein
MRLVFMATNVQAAGKKTFGRVEEPDMSCAKASWLGLLIDSRFAPTVSREAWRYMNRGRIQKPEPVTTAPGRVGLGDHFGCGTIRM